MKSLYFKRCNIWAPKHLTSWTPDKRCKMMLEGLRIQTSSSYCMLRLNSSRMKNSPSPSQIVMGSDSGSLSLSSSGCVTSVNCTFVHSVPVRLLKAVTQCSPCFLHEQDAVEQFPLHLHQMMFKTWSGVNGPSTVVGISCSCTNFQPQPQSVASGVAFPSDVQIIARRWTWLACIFAALSDGDKRSTMN